MAQAFLCIKSHLLVESTQLHCFAKGFCRGYPQFIKSFTVLNKGNMGEKKIKKCLRTTRLQEYCLINKILWMMNWSKSRDYQLQFHFVVAQQHQWHRKRFFSRAFYLPHWFVSTNNLELFLGDDTARETGDGWGRLTVLFQYPTISPEKLYFVPCRMTAGTLKNHLVYGWIEVRTRLGNHQYQKAELYYYDVDVPQVILTVKLSFFSPHTLYNACFSRDSMRV